MTTFYSRARRYFVAAASYELSLLKGEEPADSDMDMLDSLWKDFTALERKRIEELDTAHARIRFITKGIGVDVNRPVGRVNGVFNYIDEVS